MRLFDRDTYFDSVRKSLFYGVMDQGQVDGQNAILRVWEVFLYDWDIRWLAYALATTIHETASTMLPISEYGEGKGMAYGKVDPETGQTYYGRGFVQLTWRDNYARADRELHLTAEHSCEWHADNALDPWTAARVMFKGMEQGWFRQKDGTPNNFAKYFNASEDDPIGARDIINGDIEENGPLVAGYHQNFMAALTAARSIQKELVA